VDSNVIIIIVVVVIDACDLQELKETYRQHRRIHHSDTTDMFDRRAVSRTTAQTMPAVATTLGPTPFCSPMSDSAVVAMVSALNRTQPIAGHLLVVYMVSQKKTDSEIW